MPEMDLGRRQACSDCGTLFFDLYKLPPVCPSCGQEVRLTPPRASTPVPKLESAADDAVDDPVDATKQEDDEFDDHSVSVTLGSSKQPVRDGGELDDG